MKLPAIFRLFFGLLALLSCFAKAQVVINEYSCANLNGPPDNFGSNEDWIELYNTGSAAVNLTGFHLSDKAGNPTKWQFPSGNISPGGFLVVWASGRDTVTGSNYHTNFKLTQTKPEKIIFADPSGTILDSLTLIPTLKDHARGRNPDGGNNWAVYTTVTNGASNTNPQQEYATRPAMSLAPGFYSGSQTVTITSPDANITIHYTTDGSSPTTSSAVYSSPLTISATTVLRAKAFSSVSAIPASFVESNTYFINSPHTIDVISIFGGSLLSLLNGNVDNPETGLEYFDKTGAFKTETYGTSNEHGNDSWAYDQRGIDYVVNDKYGYNYAIKHQLFNNKDRTEFQRVILKAAANDNYPFESGGAHIRDQYVHTLSQHGGLNLDERTWAPCIVYVNGQYWGVYDIREKVDDGDFLEYYYDQYEKYDGASQYVQFLKTWGGTWSEFGGNQAQTDWDNLRNFITSNNMAVQANFDYVDSLYNWKSLIDYFVLNSYVLCKDWLNWNTAWWRGLHPDGNKKKWRYVLWDMDATFGHYVNYTGIPDESPSADPCNAEQLSDPGGQGHTEIMNALMANSTFKQYYVSRYIDLSNTTFQCAYMIGLLDSMLAIIGPEMPGQVNRWGGSLAGWQANVQDMKDFINSRCAALSTGLTDCYQVTGPYDLTVDVIPAGTGKVNINSITPANYAFSGSYFGNINILLNAIPDPGYVFDHWESVSGDTINPDTFDPSAYFNMEGTDTIIAHFKPITNTVDLTVIVSPAGSGKVELNGSLLNSYPYTSSYPSGTNFGIVAIPNPGYIFSHWTLNNTAILPNTLNDTAAFTLTMSDTLTAYFDSIPATLYNLTVIVSPPGSGNVNLEGFILFAYPYNTTYPAGTNLDIKAIANAGFTFSAWQLLNNTLNPNNTSDTANFILNASDTLIAFFDSIVPLHQLTVFVSPASSGNVNLDGTLLSIYPYTVDYPEGASISLGAIPATNYQFDYWTILNHSLSPGNAAENVTLVNFMTSDTVTAYFKVIPDSGFKGVYVPGGFSPNDDNNNEVLYVFAGTDVVSFQMNIYDRWGNLVFQTVQATTGWDGMYNGKKAEAGVYAYQLTVKMKDGAEQVKGGDITLVR